MISVWREYNYLEMPELETHQGYIDALLNASSAQTDESLSMKLRQIQGGVGMWEFALLRIFQLINRGFKFVFLSFFNNNSWLSSAIDCEKRFVSSVNHFVAHHPHFTPAEYEGRKSIYFPKIAISLVYSMKMSLYRDEKESHSNLLGACLNVIMRFCCTPAILIYRQ